MSINNTLLMSDARHFSSAQAINPHYFDPHANPHKAQKEHDAIRNAFEKAGIHVLTVASPKESQDGVYTANWALVRGDTAVLARLPNVRKAEEAYARAILTKLGKTVVTVPEPYKFSGQGDALACGDYLFCGSGYRSDEEAQKFAAETLGYTRIQLQTIPQLDAEGAAVINTVSDWPDSFYYDIDLALSILRAPSPDTPGLIAYCAEAFTPHSRRILENISSLSKGAIEAITISQEEAMYAFAANLVSTGTHVIMSAKAPSFTKELEKRGFSIITPEINELVKGGGYIRCTSLSLD